MRKAVGLRGDLRGELLIEVLIALALLGLISVVFIGAMYTSLHAARISDERSVGLTLAKSQIEFVKARDYADDDWAYVVGTNGATIVTKPSWWDANTPAALDAEFAGYTVQVSGVSSIDLDESGVPDDGIRVITATSLHNGVEIVALQNYEIYR
jgi:type II secretory pathway pseudopilin PulG